MRVKSNRKEDILKLKLGLSADPIDHAEEAGPLIAHFATDDKLVLLETLEASEFLSKLTRGMMRAENEMAVEAS